ncbi:MAG: ferrochelatase [Magnetococcales bacterium]|nr:ferrochelatase [Magnetococcales bacterium]
MTTTAVLLTQLGTPDAPTTTAVRRYLREFLSDPFVVDAPRLLWWPLLHGVILRTRPSRSAALYRHIWRADGVSPLLHYSRLQHAAVAASLPESVVVTLAMRYGNPSLAEALRVMLQARVNRLLVFPLYPQYASSTTGSTQSAVMNALAPHRFQPTLRFAAPFHDQKPYITALATLVREHLAQAAQAAGENPLLLISFHGIPQRHVDAGDPYAGQCHETAQLLARELGLPASHWRLVFQSRFGREPWLEPALATELAQLPGEGIRSVVVVCPGFVADCLETLEEIDGQGRDIFMRAGGRAFHYIPCLNDHPPWLDALAGLVSNELAGWPCRHGPNV